jgi:epoxyqueuosine reductase
MAANAIAELICSRLEEKGYRGIVVPIEHVAQLKSEIEEGISQGKIAAGVYDRYLAEFQFDVATRFPKARSIIMTAARQPQRKVTFHLNGRTHPVIIPPTYYNDTDKQIKNILQNILTFNDYQLYPAALPLKLLGARSGLTKYGKNNIAYVEGLGSFVRLRAFLSDVPAGRSEWLEPRAMKACNKCQACLNECPTGAIAQDRFLLHAERCITFFNEGSEAFPGWIDPAWHNSLVGCMKCQLVCPVNKPFFKWVEDGEDFDETETELILNRVPVDRMSAETVRKLNRCYMMEYLELLPRNFRALLKK